MEWAANICVLDTCNNCIYAYQYKAALSVAIQLLKVYNKNKEGERCSVSLDVTVNLNWQPHPTFY